MPGSRRPQPPRFTDAAAADLDEAFAYVGAQKHSAATAATELLTALRSAVERLADFPDLGVMLSPEDFTLVTPGIRFLVVEPYVIYCRKVDEGVVILRILHSRRDYLDELLG